MSVLANAPHEDGSPTDMAAPACEMWFYHLERTDIGATLPPLLEKCAERGWRAIVRSPSQPRLVALDKDLWTYRPNAWLPHGLACGDADVDDRQPILLEPLSEAATPPPNCHCDALFLLDGADWAGVTGVKRIFIVFDGRDEAALVAARADWRRAKAAGFDAAYWQQNEAGQWARKS
ncbi:MAG: hypothetical protein RLZZ157_1469 [Pseudomonadota bacterium]|jgi:DNA polymerase-3 subunit chi